MMRCYTSYMSWFPRFLSGFLAFVVFMTNVVLVSASESNFWAERGRAAQREKSFSLTKQNSLLAQLPPAVPLPFGGYQNIPVAGVSGDISASGGRGDGSQKGARTAFLSTLLPFGYIRESYFSQKADAPLIVHIQDAHGIEEAQKNIAAMIQELGESRGIKLVGVEGAHGHFSIAPYRDFPGSKATQPVAEFFLKKGFIAGPEFAGLTAPTPPLLWGVEHMPLYESNIRAYKEAIKEKPPLESLLREYKTAIGRLKDKIYSTTLKDFDGHVTAYRRGEEGLGAYIRSLRDLSPHWEKKQFPHLSLLLDTLSVEDSLDFKSVEKERLSLVETLTAALSSVELTSLVQGSLHYRAGTLRGGEYYDRLQRLCRAHRIRLKDFGPLNDYIAYVLMAEKIDRNALLSEMERLETSLETVLSTTPKQKRLVALNRLLILMEKLTTHSMTPEDWAAWTQHREKSLEISSELQALDTAQGVPLPSLSATQLKPFEDFCFHALERNDALIENLTAKMRSERASAAILVTGGFHSDGLVKLFQSKDVSYVVVTPKISEVPQDSNYLDVFVHDTLPMDKLFEGETIFLAHPEALADSTLTMMEGTFAQGAQQVRAGLSSSLSMGQPGIGQMEWGDTILRIDPRTGQVHVHRKSRSSFSRFRARSQERMGAFLEKARLFWKNNLLPDYRALYAKSPRLTRFLRAPLGENARIVLPGAAVMLTALFFFSPVVAWALGGLWIVPYSWSLTRQRHRDAVVDRKTREIRPATAWEQALTFVHFLTIGFGSLGGALVLGQWPGGLPLLLVPQTTGMGVLMALPPVFLGAWMLHAGMQVLHPHYQLGLSPSKELDDPIQGSPWVSLGDLVGAINDRLMPYSDRPSYQEWLDAPEKLMGWLNEQKGTYEPARLHIHASRQSVAKEQALVELVANGLDILDPFIRRFGMGFYQALGELDGGNYVYFAGYDASGRRLGVAFRGNRKALEIRPLDQDELEPILEGTTARNPQTTVQVVRRMDKETVARYESFLLDRVQDVRRHPLSVNGKIINPTLALTSDKKIPIDITINENGYRVRNPGTLDPRVIFENLIIPRQGGEPGTLRARRENPEQKAELRPCLLYTSTF